MAEITVCVWLYGELTCYGRHASTGSYTTFDVKLLEGSMLKDLLDYLLMCTNERGITLINSLISAVPGVQPDLDTILQNNDQIILLPPQWTSAPQPYSISSMTAQMLAAMNQQPAHQQQSS